MAAKHAPAVTAAVKTIFAHSDPAEVAAQVRPRRRDVGGQLPKVATMLGEAKTDCPAFTAFPKAHWQKIWSNNPIERLQQRRSKYAAPIVVGGSSP